MGQLILLRDRVAIAPQPTIADPPRLRSEKALSYLQGMHAGFEYGFRAGRKYGRPSLWKRVSAYVQSINWIAIVMYGGSAGLMSVLLIDGVRCVLHAVAP